MPLWQRIAVTLVAIAAVSWVAITLIEALIGFRLPGYIAGVIGGIAGVPVWEVLRRVQPRA